MKKKQLCILICTALILCVSGTAMAKLFVLKIDGEKIVVDFYVQEEQVWQEAEDGDQGWWPGVSPHPYEFKIWYPFLEDTFDMTLEEQLEWIEDLEYAGIDDWRIGYFWDTTPLKASLFGGLTLGTVNLSVYNTYIYFPPTACGPSRMEMISGFPYGCMTLGRTGNEEGVVSGALINAMDLGMDSGFPRPPNERYLTEGVEARAGGIFPFPLYYTLPQSEAQDHWMNFYMHGAPYDTPSNPYLIWYNEDLNYNRDDDTIGLMSPVDEKTGERPIGAWTVTEAMPQFNVKNKKAHEIEISDVIQPDGELVPVSNVSVYRIGGFHEDSSFSIRVKQKGDSTVVELTSDDDDDAGIYGIEFSDSDRSYTFKVQFIE